MSCDCENKHPLQKPRHLPPPCLPCALEHLDLAADAVESGHRHLAVWHLARAGEVAPQAAAAIRSARIEYQKSGRPIDWDHLQRLIK